MTNISTAFAIQFATESAVQDENSMKIAREILAGIRNGMNENTFTEKMFEYSATLASMVATRVALAILKEEGMEAMMNELMELENLDV